MQNDNYIIYYMYNNFPYLMKYEKYRTHIFIQVFARNLFSYEIMAAPSPYYEK